MAIPKVQILSGVYSIVQCKNVSYMNNCTQVNNFRNYCFTLFPPLRSWMFLACLHRNRVLPFSHFVNLPNLDSIISIVSSCALKVGSCFLMHPLINFDSALHLVLIATTCCSANLLIESASNYVCLAV